VPKFAKPILFAAAIAAAILCAFYLAINLYLQSQGVQKRIQSQASNAIGGLVEIRGTSYTPWGGLTLSGIGVRQSEESQPFFEAGRIRLHIQLLPLLGGKVILQNITVDKPILALRENEPFPPPRPERATEVEAPPSPAPARDRKVTVEIRNFHIREGTVLFYNSRGAIIARMEKIQNRTKFGQLPAMKGTLRASTLNGPTTTLRNLDVPYEFDGITITARFITAEIAGGKLKAEFTANLETGFYQCAFALNEALLPTMLEESGIPGGRAKGSLHMEAEMEGNLRNQESIAGTGFVELRESQIEPVEAIRQLGTLFQIDELQLLTLSQARADFTLSGQGLHLDPVFLQSENLIIDSKGTVDFQGNLDLQSRLLLNEKLYRNLRMIVGKNLEEAPEEGYRQIPFEVSGPISNPNINLMEKLNLGGGVGGFLRNIIRQPGTSQDNR
jgi:hypothetical protein